MDDDSNDIGTIVRAAREKAGLTQAELAQRVGAKQQTIGKIEDGITKKSSYLLAISMQLGIPGEKLAVGKRPTTVTKIPAAELLTDKRDLPIHSSARGGRGELIVSTEPIEYLLRPEPLEGVLKGYGIRIVGESMMPELDEGDIALVHPHLLPARDQTCVFYSEMHGEARAIIKRLVRFTDTLWHVRQWNPPAGEKADYTLPRKEWTICHRVVGKYSKR